MPRQSLRDQVLRLASADPELRTHLLRALKATPSEAEGSPEDRLKKELQPLGKNAYWKPPHNLAVNFALMGANLWVFTILPLFWQKKAYREDLKGIVIHPIWTSVKEGRTLGNVDLGGFREMNAQQVQALLGIFPKMPNIEQTVSKELAAIETHFGIQIPGDIQRTLIQESLKTAKRRWGVDRLRVKNRLIPLDGSKPRDLGAWG